MRARTQSTLSDLDPPVTLIPASALSAGHPRQSSVGDESFVVCDVVSTSISSLSLPATVTDVTVFADSPAAPETTIPLCVTRMVSNDFDQYALNNEPDDRQTISDSNSVGRKKVC